MKKLSSVPTVTFIAHWLLPCGRSCTQTVALTGEPCVMSFTILGSSRSTMARVIGPILVSAERLSWVKLICSR